MSKFQQPAFPTTDFSSSVANTSTYEMTLRDYFAAKVMQSLIPEYKGFRTEGWEDDCAGNAYRMANAMMKAREAEELKP